MLLSELVSAADTDYFKHVETSLTDNSYKVPKLQLIDIIYERVLQATREGLLTDQQIQTSIEEWLVDYEVHTPIVEDTPQAYNIMLTMELVS